ncbi:TVG0735005 [Thermoplasma volcanium GSS1]|uniref:TVG0735005 protein n=1 Tax=Thermoplasma volcanium (strain ATCC 51530 / DSM 4299 / JCM 9571 / NBRC 15438 / GSS1) TaxID=273116 RepID=Q97AT1_THEVO|nr:hypothetical protein [Thermoplasma volcanium]BAB59870.1 TVG0735005 [Thermoplasma volcanium GSS1]
MSENQYITKKEIIEELLYKDRNFFLNNNPEFNIFKYTAFFAVVTFTFQPIIVMVNIFSAFSYLIYIQLLEFQLSFYFIIALIMLYIGLTRAIRTSYYNRKGVYLRLYKCRICDFTSFSEFYSNLHIVSHPDHTLKYNQILIKYAKEPKKTWFTRLSTISKRKRLEKNYDRDFIILSKTDQRNENEIKGGKWLQVRSVGIILSIIILQAYIYYSYSLFRSPEIIIGTLIIFGIFYIICFYIFIQLNTQDVENAHIFKLELEYKQEQENPYIVFHHAKIDLSYWKSINKKLKLKPIEVQDGELFIVDKIVINNCGEIIDAIPEES